MLLLYVMFPKGMSREVFPSYWPTWGRPTYTNGTLGHIRWWLWEIPIGLQCFGLPRLRRNLAPEEIAKILEHKFGKMEVNLIKLLKINSSKIAKI